MASIADQGSDVASAPQARRLNVTQVAALFRVTPRTISRWADAGLLTCTRTLGGPTRRGHRRFTEAEVYAVLRTLRGAR